MIFTPHQILFGEELNDLYSSPDIIRWGAEWSVLLTRYYSVYHIEKNDSIILIDCRALRLQFSVLDVTGFQCIMIGKSFGFLWKQCQIVGFCKRRGIPSKNIV